MTLNGAIRCQRGLPPERDEPWFLITDLGRSAVAVSAQEFCAGAGYREYELLLTRPLTGPPGDVA